MVAGKCFDDSFFTVFQRLFHKVFNVSCQQKILHTINVMYINVVEDRCTFTTYGKSG